MFAIVNVMKKYLTKQFANKLLLTGGITYVVSFGLNLVTLFTIYGKAGCDNPANCTLGTEQIAATIGQYMSYAGIGIFIVGLALLIISQSRKDK